MKLVLLCLFSVVFNSLKFKEWKQESDLEQIVASGD